MLPTGFRYSSLANRFMPGITSGTCGVGRRVFRSCASRATRRGEYVGARGTAVTGAGRVRTIVDGAIQNSTPVVSRRKKKVGRVNAARTRGWTIVLNSKSGVT